MAYNSEKGISYVIKEKNICYIPISKNGTTTFRNCCSKHNIKYEVKNFIEEPEILTDNHVVAIVREPLERFCSGYIEITIRPHDSPKSMEKDFFFIETEPERIMAFIEEISKDFFDTHIEPQMYYLTDEEDTPIDIDQWVLLRDMSDEFTKLLGVPFDKKNASNHEVKSTFMPPKEEYLEFLEVNTHVKAYLELLYKSDIELYNKILQEKDNEN
tara:strand:- start:78 stop:719 length:642 start_codon:yes stop_codon:yes gene_type:complete